MRSTSVTIATVLVVGFATPALAAARHHNLAPSHDATPSYDACAALSVKRGAVPGEGNSGNPDALYHAFIRQCLDGKIPL